MKRILFTILIALLTLNNSFAMEPSKESIIEDSYSQAYNFPRYLYPYNNLIHDLKAQGKTHILLFSYGSLMDKKSASNTLSQQALESRRPALAFGL